MNGTVAVLNVVTTVSISFNVWDCQLLCKEVVLKLGSPKWIWGPRFCHTKSLHFMQSNRKIRGGGWSNAFKRLSVPICMEERNYSTRVLVSLFPVLDPGRILCQLCRYTMCHQAQTQETQSCDSQSSAHMNPQQGHAGPLEQVKLSCIEVRSYYPERFQRNIRLH